MLSTAAAAVAAAASQSFSGACAEIGSRFITQSIKESILLARTRPSAPIHPTPRRAARIPSLSRRRRRRRRILLKF